MDDTRQFDAALVEIFRTVLNNPDLQLFKELTAAEVEGWDSLNHVILISTIETRFGIKFTLRELLSMESVGDIASTIRAKNGPSSLALRRRGEPSPDS
jgi:acyl carrier protein